MINTETLNVLTIKRWRLPDEVIKFMDVAIFHP